ncbi:MAG: aconitase family protein, partial [Limibacillus sp.]
MKLGQDSLKTRRTLDVDGESFDYYSLPAAAEAGIGDLSRLPFSLKVLLENLLRFEDGDSVSVEDIKSLAARASGEGDEREIAYRPARVLMQDFTGVPAVVDLAAMRQAMVKLGGDPRKINPLSPCDLVIDHSVMVDYFGGPDAFKKNEEREFERNRERYEFLRWGQSAFDDFKVVPPGTGICHQVNLEYLAQTVWTNKVEGKNIGRSNETTPQEQAEKEARAAWQKKLDRKYSLTPEEARETVFLPMLAHNWRKQKRYPEFPLDVQPKLDGVRCIAHRDNGKVKLMDFG